MWTTFTTSAIRSPATFAISTPSATIPPTPKRTAPSAPSRSTSFLRAAKANWSPVPATATSPLARPPPPTRSHLPNRFPPAPANSYSALILYFRRCRAGLLGTSSYRERPAAFVAAGFPAGDFEFVFSCFGICVAAGLSRGSSIFLFSQLLNFYLDRPKLETRSHIQGTYKGREQRRSWNLASPITNILPTLCTRCSRSKDISNLPALRKSSCTSSNSALRRSTVAPIALTCTPKTHARTAIPRCASMRSTPGAKRRSSLRANVPPSPGPKLSPSFRKITHPMNFTIPLARNSPNRNSSTLPTPSLPSTPGTAWPLPCAPSPANISLPNAKPPRRNRRPRVCSSRPSGRFLCLYALVAAASLTMSVPSFCVLLGTNRPRSSRVSSVLYSRHARATQTRVQLLDDLVRRLLQGGSAARRRGRCSSFAASQSRPWRRPGFRFRLM